MLTPNSKEETVRPVLIETGIMEETLVEIDPELTEIEAALMMIETVNQDSTMIPGEITTITPEMMVGFKALVTAGIQDLYLTERIIRREGADPLSGEVMTGHLQWMVIVRECRPGVTGGVVTGIIL